MWRRSVLKPLHEFMSRLSDSECQPLSSLLAAPLLVGLSLAMRLAFISLDRKEWADAAMALNRSGLIDSEVISKIASTYGRRLVSSLAAIELLVGDDKVAIVQKLRQVVERLQAMRTSSTAAAALAVIIIVIALRCTYARKVEPMEPRPPRPSRPFQGKAYKL